MEFAFYLHHYGRRTWTGLVSYHSATTILRELDEKENDPTNPSIKVFHTLFLGDQKQRTHSVPDTHPEVSLLYCLVGKMLKKQSVGVYF